MIPVTLVMQLGLQAVPGWLRPDWVPRLRLVDSPALEAVRGEHVALVGAVEAADRACGVVIQREGPADASARMVWRVDDGPGGMAANRAVTAAREALESAVVELCDWLVARRRDPEDLQRELHRLMTTVARNDEQRWPEVQAVGRFVGQVGDRDVARSVERVRRQLRVVDPEYSAGVTW